MHTIATHLSLMLLLVIQQKNQSIEEHRLIDRIDKSRTSRERGSTTYKLYDYYLKYNLLDTRTNDNNLTIKLLALWRMGTLTDEAVPKRIVEAIKQETGRPPPRILAEAIYSYRKTWKRQDIIVDIDYSNSVPLIKASIDNNSVQVNDRDILSKEQCKQSVYSYDEMKQLAGKKLKAVAFEHDGLQVIICYYDDFAEHQAVVVLVDSGTKHVLWHELLYGGGNYRGFSSGVALPRKYYCDITSKYVCIYGDGPTGGVFVELYERKTGKRIHAFSTKNWLV